MKRLITRTAYYTYIVQCADETYYVGKTYDLVERLRQHNGEKKGGGKYTRGRRPVVLRYYEKLATNKLACEREAFFKKLTRQEKEDLINKKEI